jgi:hypothetical protein
VFLGRRRRREELEECPVEVGQSVGIEHAAAL